MADNGTQSANLTPLQQRAVAALLGARDVREAAKTAGVSERTLWRWLKEPVFAAALKQATQTCIEQATRRLVGGTQEALDTLWQVMKDDKAPSSARLRAATAWLDYHHTFRELDDIEARLAALEEKVI